MKTKPKHDAVPAEKAPAATPAVDPVAYEQGRAAKRASIAAEDCPHGNGALKNAWLNGYESV